MFQNHPAKRLVEDYDKSLYFANIKDRGYSKISSLKCNDLSVEFVIPETATDIVRITLPSSLAPKDKVKLRIVYEVKIPKDKYTGYGRNELNYSLRYWHMTPAVFDKKWHLFSNLNSKKWGIRRYNISKLDDYYVQPTDFNIEFEIPIGYTLHSDLEQEALINEDHVLYSLSGKNRLDIELNIQPINNFSVYNTEETEIITNIKSKNLSENIKSDVLQRQLDFIEVFCF